MIFSSARRVGFRSRVAVRSRSSLTGSTSRVLLVGGVIFGWSLLGVGCVRNYSLSFDMEANNEAILLVDGRRDTEVVVVNRGPGKARIDYDFTAERSGYSGTHQDGSVIPSTSRIGFAGRGRVVFTTGDEATELFIDVIQAAQMHVGLFPTPRRTLD